MFVSSASARRGVLVAGLFAARVDVSFHAGVEDADARANDFYREVVFDGKQRPADGGGAKISRPRMVFWAEGSGKDIEPP